MRSKTLWIIIAALATVCSLADGQKPDVRWKRITDIKRNERDFHILCPVFPGKSSLATIANSYYTKESREYLTEAQKAYDDYQSIKDITHVELTLDYSVGIGVNRTDLISAISQASGYYGGAHGFEKFRPTTFGIINGKATKLKLNDLVRNKALRKKLQGEIVLPKLNLQRKDRGAGTDWEFPDEAMERFVVTPSGLTWVFEPYLVGPYSDGDYTVKVGFADLRPYLNPNGPLKGLLKG